MRRSDEEFKKELLLRVEEYKARQRKRRENALRAASVAVMVCVLVVSSQWGRIANEEWYEPTDQPEAEGTMESQGVTQEDSVTDAAEENESTNVPATENHAGTTETTGPVQEEVTDVPAGTVELSGVSIWEQKVQFNSAGLSGSSDETKNYQDEELAEVLLEFLMERIETAKEIAEESTTGERPESESTSMGSDSSNSSLGKKYRITIRYADGRAIAYQVAEGKDELKIKGGRLILDQESWGQLMQIVGNDLKD